MNIFPMRVFRNIGFICLSMLVQSCEKRESLLDGTSRFVVIRNHNDVLRELKRSKDRDGHPRNPIGYIVHSSISIRDFWPIFTKLAIDGQHWVDIMRSNDQSKFVRVDFPFSDNNQINWQGNVARYLELPTTAEAVGIDSNTGIRYIRLSVSDGEIRLGNDIVDIDQVKARITVLQPNIHRVAVGINVLSGSEKLFGIFDLLYMIQNNGCKFSIHYAGGV